MVVRWGSGTHLDAEAVTTRRAAGARPLVGADLNATEEAEEAMENILLVVIRWLKVC